MSNVVITDSQFNPNGYWTEPVAKILYQPTTEDIDLFDQEGYDLTIIEQHFAYSNWAKPKQHRNFIRAIKEDWFVQERTLEGSVLNHSYLFERKGYAGKALEELKHWAKTLPLLYKVISIRPKWGLDFSMDWVDREGNAFEVLHWEWDSFVFEETQTMKDRVEPILAAVDWQDVGKYMLKHKDQWYHLDYFAQGDWKSDYLGISPQKFKLVTWI